jgi:hypothetical protein
MEWLRSNRMFALPDGHTPAEGKFIRGADSKRAVGTPQADAFQGHSFGGKTKDGQPLRLQYSSFLRVPPDAANGVTGKMSTGLWGDNVGSFSEPNTPEFISDGKHGDPRVANETRPANVALLFCKKD